MQANPIREQIWIPFPSSVLFVFSASVYTVLNKFGYPSPPQYCLFSELVLTLCCTLPFHDTKLAEIAISWSTSTDRSLQTILLSLQTSCHAYLRGNSIWSFMLHWVCHYRVCDMHVCKNRVALDASSCAVSLTRHCDTHVCNVSL